MKKLIGAYALAIAVTLGGFFYPYHPDEQVFLRVAQAINDGKLPYKDVTDNKPPGIYYFLAGGIFLFGESKWFRVLMIVINLVSAGLLYRLARNKWLPCLLLIWLPIYQGQFALTEGLMLPWLLAGTYALIKKPKPFLAGLFWGIAFMFKQTALINWIAGLWWLKPNKLLPYFVGFGIIPGLFYGALFMRLPPSILIKDVFSDYLVAYPPTALIDSLGEMMKLWSPVIIYLVFFMNTLYMRGVTDELVIYSIQLVWLGIPLLLYRPYHHYWIQFLPYILIVAAASPWVLFLIHDKRRIIKPFPQTIKSSD